MLLVHGIEKDMEKVINPSDKYIGELFHAKNFTIGLDKKELRYSNLAKGGKLQLLKKTSKDDIEKISAYFFNLVLKEHLQYGYTIAFYSKNRKYTLFLRIEVLNRPVSVKTLRAIKIEKHKYSDYLNTDPQFKCYYKYGKRLIGLKNGVHFNTLSDMLLNIKNNVEINNNTIKDVSDYFHLVYDKFSNYDIETIDKILIHAIHLFVENAINRKYIRLHSQYCEYYSINPIKTETPFETRIARHKNRMSKITQQKKLDKSKWNKYYYVPLKTDIFQDFIRSKIFKTTVIAYKYIEQAVAIVNASHVIRLKISKSNPEYSKDRILLNNNYEAGEYKYVYRRTSKGYFSVDHGYKCPYRHAERDFNNVLWERDLPTERSWEL